MSDCHVDGHISENGDDSCGSDIADSSHSCHTAESSDEDKVETTAVAAAQAAQYLMAVRNAKPGVRKAQAAAAKAKDAAERRRAQWAGLLADSRPWSGHARLIRKLGLAGLPEELRGDIWQRAVGNVLAVTPELYRVCQHDAASMAATMASAEAGEGAAGPSAPSPADPDSRAWSLRLIARDISRTMPTLPQFQPDGELAGPLAALLSAWTRYRPDIGYVQGQAAVAGMLLLHMPADRAFVAFANMVAKPPLFSMYSLNPDALASAADTFMQAVREQCPAAARAMAWCDVTPMEFLPAWLFTLFVKPLHLQLAQRLWDAFLCGGDESWIWRCALGIIACLQPHLGRAAEAENDRQIRALLNRVPLSVTASAVLQAAAKARWPPGAPPSTAARAKQTVARWLGRY